MQIYLHIVSHTAFSICTPLLHIPYSHHGPLIRKPHHICKTCIVRYCNILSSWDTNDVNHLVCSLLTCYCNPFRALVAWPIAQSFPPGPKQPKKQPPPKYQCATDYERRASDYLCPQFHWYEVEFSTPWTGTKLSETKHTLSQILLLSNFELPTPSLKTHSTTVPRSAHYRTHFSGLLGLRSPTEHGSFLHSGKAEYPLVFEVL